MDDATRARLDAIRPGTIIGKWWHYPALRALLTAYDTLLAERVQYRQRANSAEARMGNYKADNRRLSEARVLVQRENAELLAECAQATSVLEAAEGLGISLDETGAEPYVIITPAGYPGATTWRGHRDSYRDTAAVRDAIGRLADALDTYRAARGETP